MEIRYPVWIEVNCWKSLFAWIIKFLYGLNCVAESKLTYFTSYRILVYGLNCRPESKFTYLMSFRNTISGLNWAEEWKITFIMNFRISISGLNCVTESKITYNWILELRRLNWDENQIIRYPITLIHRFIGSNRLIVKKEQKNKKYSDFHENLDISQF